ncbi:cyclic beta 1-2 glucan synthetase, partial [Candidatus Sumerlaeota bacterium]|nr:cyclic beta 1-2 glucan synthetase [Candidatus Sumerlaeota bacterium]
MKIARWASRKLKVAWRGRFAFPSADEEQPLRAEMFGLDQLERYAKALAATHEVGHKPGPDRLLPRLAENEQVLHRVYALVADVAEGSRRITPASEWLLDNFYLIEEQIRTAKRHLPRGYSRELPRLINPSRAGFPRVYDLALELISHVDGSVGEETLRGFIAAYQSVTTLTLGELWAIPIMLRLALIENLRRVAASLASETSDRNEADFWADQIVATAESDSSSIIITVADMARANPPMTGAFVAEFARRLRGRNPSLAVPLTWIEQRLSDLGLTLERLVRSDGQKQAADQVSIGNSIGSLRFIGSKDWREFVEAASAVEKMLRDDPANVYATMDFMTRDRYRHVVEGIARHGSLSEPEVARMAIELARGGETASAATGGRPTRESHVGYCLIDRGLPRLERAAGVRFSIGNLARKTGRRAPLLLYLGSMSLITGMVTWGGLI